LGTLFVITSGVREFSEQDVELIMSIGGQIGVAVENAKLYERAQQVAVVEERQRMARELHDSVTQSLYSLTLFSEAARHLAEEHGYESIERQIKQVGVIGTQALKEMRLLVYELQPLELERDGLVRALRKRLEAVEGRAGIDARVEVEELVRLPGKVEQEFFRIAQEALNNALKHAVAASVVVYLRQEDGQIEMEIVDNGVGFDPASIQDSAGMGLVSIQERAEQLDGTVTVDSKPGEGTRIKVSLADVENIEKQGPPDEGGVNE
jgi:signal transduction histidine kinase